MRQRGIEDGGDAGAGARTEQQRATFGAEAEFTAQPVADGGASERTGCLHSGGDAHAHRHSAGQDMTEGVITVDFLARMPRFSDGRP